MSRKFFYIVLHIILFILSCISILIYLIFKKNKVGTYLNENKNDIVENRSLWIVKNYKPDILIVHSIHFIPSIKNFFLRKPSIYLESIYYLHSFFTDKDHDSSKYDVCIFLFKILKLDVLYLLDDVRHIKPILNAAKDRNIKTICYMHGQIYENYSILFNNQPDIYFVWSNFFKRILNNNFIKKRDTQVKIIGFKHYHYSILEYKLKERNILILEEDTINYNYYFSLLSSVKNCKFYFKPKKGLNSKKLIFPSNIKKINTEKNLFKVVSDYNINLVVGFSSNALIECYLFNILSLSIAKKNELLSKYIKKHKHVISIEDEEISKKIDFIFNNYKNLLHHYKTMVWD